MALRLPDVPAVSQKRQQNEYCAQHVFPLRNPSDGLHIQGVYCKRGSDQEAAARLSSCAIQPQVEQDYVGPMQQQIGEMMPGCVQPKKLKGRFTCVSPNKTLRSICICGGSPWAFRYGTPSDTAVEIAPSATASDTARIVSAYRLVRARGRESFIVLEDGVGSCASGSR
jgi:hypothetical protein